MNNIQLDIFAVGKFGTRRLFFLNPPHVRTVNRGSSLLCGQAQCGPKYLKNKTKPLSSKNNKNENKREKSAEENIENIHVYAACFSQNPSLTPTSQINRFTTKALLYKVNHFQLNLFYIILVCQKQR